MAALTWVCYSERLLQVDELCHALAVEIGATDFNPENVHSISTLIDCLITVDAEASTVGLIHYTVKEYLCSHRGLFSQPHSVLAETRPTHLNSQQVKNLTPHSPPPLKACHSSNIQRGIGEHIQKKISQTMRGPLR